MRIDRNLSLFLIEDRRRFSPANNDIHLIRLCRVRRVTQEEEENICLLIEEKKRNEKIIVINKSLLSV